MKKAEFWAVVAELEKPGEWNIVGLWTPSAGHLPCVSSSEDAIKQAWELVHPDTKTKKNARIARFVEAE